MGAGIGSEAIMGSVTIIVLFAIVGWGMFRALWRSDPQGSAFPGRGGGYKRQTIVPIPVPVRVRPHPGKRRTR